jgi:5'-deoxynucleotidase
MHSFFATISRMKYIERWALMRNSRPENLSEHALEVAVIAHVLCTIGNQRYGRDLNADRAAMLGLYHDVTEIITGDMPTPVKYHSREIRRAYHEVEDAAAQRLLLLLPEDLRDTYRGILLPEKSEKADQEAYLCRLVKAADKLSALIKCVEEENAGNGEFRTAKQTIQASVDEMASQMPEVSDFCRDFLPAYGSTLDELL